MINIAICDDNVVFLEKLSHIVKENFAVYTDDFKVIPVTTGNLLLAQQKENPFDVIFLDIDMPKMSGFDIAKELRDEFANCFIIFVTNHSELVYESMDFQPFNFIRKNCAVSIDKSVKNIVEKLMRHMKQNKKVIVEDDISGRCAVYIRDIAYIESNKHYVIYHIINKELSIKMRGSMRECEEFYGNYDFVRIHKRYLINLRFLSNFDNGRNEVTLEPLHRRLPMSKNFKKMVYERYTLFLRAMI